jgi:hypothetical protein
MRNRRVLASKLYGCRNRCVSRALAVQSEHLGPPAMLDDSLALATFEVPQASAAANRDV